MINACYPKTLAVLLIGSWLPADVAFGQSVMGLQVTASPAQAEPIILSIDDLDDFEQEEFTTSTIWTDRDVTFSGVPLIALLESFDARGNLIELTALNDYAVTIPFADLEDNAPIVATRMNGELMSVRDYGPYWLVYQYDQDVRYQTETTYSRSIWQLNRIEVLDQ